MSRCCGRAWWPAPARGPARYFGSEEAAAEQIVDAVEALDVECRIGIADVLEVAVLAAQRVDAGPAGGSAAFCAALPITELARDPVIGPPDRVALIDLLIRLGITTARRVRRAPAGQVATRFGADGVRAHRLALGRPNAACPAGASREDLTVEQVLRPAAGPGGHRRVPARALAERFHARLADAGLACTRLVITAAPSAAPRCPGSGGAPGR